MNSRTSAGKRRGRGAASSGKVDSRVKARFNGRVFKPAADPPTIVPNPWNSITVSLGYVGDKKVVIKDIIPPLAKQAGFAGATPNIEVRVRSIRLWCLNPSRVMRANFYAFENTASRDKSPLAVVEDWPSLTSFARAGYEWPAAYQLVCGYVDSDEMVFSVDVSDADKTPWLAYMDCLWRGADPQPVSETVRARLLSLTAPPALSHTASRFSSLSMGEPLADEDALDCVVVRGGE